MKAFKGNIIYTETFHEFKTLENGYVLLDDGGTIVKVIADPEETKGYELVDYSGKLIIPGFTDCHVHASQMPTIGIGYNTELIEWLDRHRR